MRIRSATSRFTSSEEAKGRVFCVSTPPPQKVICDPNSCFSQAGSIPAAEVCTGLRMSRPDSISMGMILVTEPQVCCQIFQFVFPCTHSFCSLK